MKPEFNVNLFLTDTQVNVKTEALTPVAEARRALIAHIKQRAMTSLSVKAIYKAKAQPIATNPRMSTLIKHLISEYGEQLVVKVAHHLQRNGLPLSGRSIDHFLFRTSAPYQWHVVRTDHVGRVVKKGSPGAQLVDIRAEIQAWSLKFGRAGSDVFRRGQLNTWKGMTLSPARLNVHLFCKKHGIYDYMVQANLVDDERICSRRRARKRKRT